MVKLTHFDINQITPFSVGFDRVFDRLVDYDTNYTTGGFPPYNIRKTDDFKHDSDVLIHKGIAKRAFTRKFTLADDIEIKDAKLENGLLLINLEQIVPEHKKPKIIKVK